jgi:hypothetical protein
MGQAKVNLARTYKVGDIDKYKFTLKFADGAVAANVVDTVTKTYSNGDADVTEKTSDAMVTMAGKARPAKEMEQEIQLKVTKFGLVIGKAPSAPAGWIIFTLAIPGPNSGLALNDSVSFSRSLMGSNGAEISPSIAGTATLSSLGSNEGKLTIQAKMQAPKGTQGGGEISGILVWDLKNSRYQAAHLKIVSQSGGSVQTSQLSMEHI